MEKTSLTHPLQIAEVKLGGGYGRIGITLCPGKVAPSLFGGNWNRDLGLDLEATYAWGAATVVTLIEDHEFEMLKVEGLGDAVREHHMQWCHLPIRDVSIPDENFEEVWQSTGEALRAQLREGFDILVHCRGGLGRAGTIAARLAVELGSTPSDAIDQVRRVRPGAIETHEQENYVHGQQFIPEFKPSTTMEAIRDRAIGALLGLAVGDALGTTLEFSSRDSYLPLQDMIGGGPFRLQPGQWTDDTAMALALADCLSGPGGFSDESLMTKFADWYKNGTYSCTGDCFDIGIATRQAIERWQSSGTPQAGSTDPRTAGNGSLMRLAPVAIRYWNDRHALRDIAAKQSRVTHAAPEAVDACVFWAELLADAIEGRLRSALFSNRPGNYAGKVTDIAMGSWRARSRDSIRSGGYVIESLEASLWSSARSSNFNEAVLTATNLGGDADTTAAITGQLAGAFYGASSIPAQYLDRLAWRSRISEYAENLFAQSRKH